MRAVAREELMVDGGILAMATQNGAAVVCAHMMATKHRVT
jgi:hypothetical protein